MTLVLVPGFMLDREMWADLEPELAACGSIHHVDISRGASIAEMAELAINDIPETFVLIGFSLGGYVAREIARRVPERIEALVLVATSGRADTPAQTRRKTLAVQLIGTPFKGMSAAAVAPSVHPDRKSDSALIERLRQMGVRLGGDTFRRQSSLSRTSDLDRLSEIRCPTLVIAAEDDELRSLAEASELVAGIPGAELKTIAHSGHMVPMEQPALLADTIKTWLGDLPQATPR